MDGTKTGFFLNFYQNTRNTLKSEDIQNFVNLQSNPERFKLVYSLSQFDKKLDLKRHERASRHQVNKDEIYFYKDFNCAMEMKKIGNKFFQNQQWNEALNFYNKSYLMMPEENENDISILFANRSAVLYHQAQYDATLAEIQRAIDAKYPNDLMYKLKERKARCMLAKKNNEEALKAFKEDIQALDDSKLPDSKLKKLEKDAQIMIKMLTQTVAIEQQAKLKMKLPAKKPEQKKKTDFVKDFVDRDSLTYGENEHEGRYAKAAKDIKLGAYLVQEKPHVSCLLQSFCQSHCHACFKRCNLPIACTRCADVIFCSEKCRDTAIATFHRAECGVLQHLWNSGISITCQMALRIIAEKTLKYFLDMRGELESLAKKVDYALIDSLPNDDYRRVFVLVTHEKDRNFEDKFHRMCVASFLTYCLKIGGFFEDDTSIDSFNFIGSLVYHNLQLLQYNAHEISELQYKGKNDTGTSVFIGGGLYPTVAFFNHSCDPGVVRYFNGNVIMLRTLKHIPAGEPVSENYGPIFTQEPKEERQAKLLQQYHFTCMCQACMENWPMFKEMDDSCLRFRCDGMSRTCKSVIRLPVDTNEFLIKCTECGETTNIMKGLKSMQDTDMLFKSATRLHESGDFKGALAKYVANLDLMDQTLVPPFRSYHLTQQGIKRCIMEFGNKAYI